MIEWLIQFWESLTWWSILLGIGMFLFSFTISFIAIAIVLVKIPADYFSSTYNSEFMPDSSWLVKWGAVIAKNILGVFLVLLGILLSLPGVPGQGLLTILLGLIMLDIPGKRPLEAKIIKRPAILEAANKFRKRYGKPPLIMD